MPKQSNPVSALPSPAATRVAPFDNVFSDRRAASDRSTAPAAAEPVRSRRAYRFGGAGAVTVSLEDLNPLALPSEVRTQLFATLDQLAELEGQVGN